MNQCFISANRTDLKEIIKTIGPATLGFALILCGFFYDGLFAGIPYQDPTPELQERWEYYKSVASVFYKTGGMVLLLGSMAIPTIWKRTKRKKH
jgi:hypothetical protein